LKELEKRTEIICITKLQGYIIMFLLTFYRYSTMDFEEMQQKSTDGQYWTNSSFALVSTLINSSDMWRLCNLTNDAEPFVEMTPFLSESIRAKLQVSTKHLNCPTICHYNGDGFKFSG
jgi:hypothetical protein